jgi:RimJ/RimL family protein N-acetyltransferase
MRLMRTPRLRLIPVTVQNAGALWNVLQQPDLRLYQDLPSVGSAAFTEMVAKRPKKLQPGATGRFEWLVHMTRVRKPVGWVSLRIAEREAQAGEIGYSIVREYRGRGVATEAVRMLIDEAFDEGGLARLNAYCVPENAASRRLLDRLGFKYEGILPHGATVSGQPVDVLMHRLERERRTQSGKSIEMPASGYPA